ncbi:uncharacterized protein [Rutidosis leptorrhynchoides]|uniref:uncharacterized protein n=1 Tax=Rutidosis leptorrhynchoides TaxID=125765 RepID=UPI003A9A625F
MKFSKLDRFLVSDDIPKIWPNISSKTLDRDLSDHCPILLRNTYFNSGPKPIRVFNTWLDLKDADSIITRAWSIPMTGNRPDCIFRNKLKNVKLELKKHSAQLDNLDTQILDHLKNINEWEALAETRPLSESEKNNWLEDKFSHLDKEKKKANMLKQKSRIKWALEGDENSKYFHNFIKNEIWDAIHDCESSKAPGPDGFNMKFFKKYWELIKHDLIKALDWFWSNSEISKGCNASFFTLIPKKPNPIGLNEYRPICLIGSYYKILTKILSNRLAKVIHKVIGAEQSAFLKGRNILDSVLIANEIIDELKRKKRKGLIFKVDFEKAFDCIEWDFLFNTMHYMGFGNKWISFIRACLSSSSISVLINGSPTDEFYPERGIRQGDPISPFLFIIVAGGLNILTKRVLSCGHLRGINVGNDNISVTHLQYADDTIFFGEWSKRNAKHISKLLKCFEKISRLKVNFQKSKLYGVGVSPQEIEDMANYISCSSGTFPFTYLGLPIGVPSSHPSSWQPIVEKFDKRLSDWVDKSISFGDRTVWKEIIKAGKIADSTGASFSSSITKCLGNGASINFWNDTWFGSERFCTLFRRLYMLETNKDASIAERIIHCNESSFGNWYWSRPPSGRATNDLMELNNIISSVTLSDRQDSWKYNLDPTGIFTTKSLTLLINSLKLGSNALILSIPRNKLLPQKVYIFIWRAIQKKIPVRFEIDKRGIDLDSTFCPLCELDIETTEHILISCPKTALIWKLVLDWWAQDVSLISNLNDAIINNQPFALNNFGSTL